jgi:hypothetical protein
MPSLLSNREGYAFVSLRIWQLRAEPNTEDYVILDGAMGVLNHIGGGTSESSAPPISAEESYRTVVEAAIVLRTPDDLVASEGHEDALTTCLEFLFDTVRAYRLIDETRISELTYERVLPIVPYRWRQLTPPEYSDSPRLMLLDHANVVTPTPELLDETKLEAYRQLLERLGLGDPLVLYRERRLEARIALSRDGEYAESSIQTAIAAEVFLSAVLGMLLWEESIRGEEITSAVDVLSSPLAKRVRVHFHPRLGGQWGLNATGPVANWYTITAGLRNRVVHRGYRPGKSESEESLQCLLDLERFICDRLAERSSRYPRTALMVLGGEGLRRRGRWSDELFGSHRIGPAIDSVRSFAAWRDRVDDEVQARG